MAVECSPSLPGLLPSSLKKYKEQGYSPCKRGLEWFPSKENAPFLLISLLAE